MAQVSISAGSSSGRASVIEKQFFVCEVKDRWTDSWRRINYLIPIQSSDVVAPSIGHASFLLHYGMIKREDRNQFEQYFDVGVLFWFVRILSVVNGGVKQEWIGVVDSDFLKPHGGDNASGDLTLDAFGILHELDRDVISTALERDGSGNIVEVDTCPVFNRKHKRGVQVFGNRSAEKAEDGAYVFSADGERWSNLDIAEAILLRHTPEDGPVWELGGQKDVLDSIYEIHKLDGLTPFQALNKLIPRGRGLGFVAECVGNKVILCVYTCLERAIPYAGVIVPENSRRVPLNVRDGFDIEEVEIVRSGASRYDEIEVRSKEHMLVCMTMSYLDQNMKQRWSQSVQEPDYLLGASTASDYDSIDDKAGANDRRRRMDDVAEVYCKHGLSPTWDKTAGTGGGGERRPALLVCDENGDVTPSINAPFVHRDKSFERWLPLEEGKDYGQNPPLQRFDSDFEPSYLRPFALIKNPDGPQYFYVDKVGEEFDGANAHLKIYPRDAAIGVEADPLHVYALGYYDPEEDPPSDVAPIFDYQDLVATVAFRTDRALKVVLQSNAAADSVKRRRKTIYVEDAEYWYIVPGTCIGTNVDGSLKPYVGDGVLRNDIDLLRQVAAFAQAWYGRERAALTVRVKRVADIAPLGSLIETAVTAESEIIVGTVASCIEKSYLQGGSSRLTTDWAELDFSGAGAR